MVIVPFVSDVEEAVHHANYACATAAGLHNPFGGHGGRVRPPGPFGREAMRRVPFGDLGVGVPAPSEGVSDRAPHAAIGSWGPNAPPQIAKAHACTPLPPSPPMP